jgi:hypothetical protein
MLTLLFLIKDYFFPHKTTVDQSTQTEQVPLESVFKNEALKESVIDNMYAYYSSNEASEPTINHFSQKIRSVFDDL